MSDLFELFKKISQKPHQAGGVPTAIICGLGNPGPEYVFTRHNAGFLAIDYYTQKRGVKLKTVRFKSLCETVTIGDDRVLIMKPQTYMNKSGEAVSAAASYYKIPAERILVISDDVCQAPGRMRIRRSGSDGGQKGLRSIISQLGTDQFPRIRIGVGEKPDSEYEMADWVLGKIPKEDEKKIYAVFECVGEAIPMLLSGRFDDAMGKYNGVKF